MFYYPTIQPVENNAHRTGHQGCPPVAGHHHHHHRRNNFPQQSAQAERHYCNPTTLIKCITWKNILWCLFVIVNTSVIPAIIILRNYQFSYVQPTDMFGSGPTGGCIIRMVYWPQTLYHIVIVLKLVSLFVLTTQFMKRYLPYQSMCAVCFMSSTFCLEWLLPFGYGFKLFWHLCGGIMLLDVSSCLPTAGGAKDDDVILRTPVHKEQPLDLNRGLLWEHSWFVSHPYNPEHFFKLVLITWWVALVIYVISVFILIIAVPLCSTNNLPRPLPIPPRYRHQQLISFSRSEVPQLSRESDELFELQSQDQETVRNSIRAYGWSRTASDLPTRIPSCSASELVGRRDPRILSLSSEALQSPISPPDSNVDTTAISQSLSDRPPRDTTQQQRILDRGLRRRDIDELFQFNYEQLQEVVKNLPATVQPHRCDVIDKAPLVSQSDVPDMPQSGSSVLYSADVRTESVSALPDQDRSDTSPPQESGRHQLPGALPALAPPMARQHRHSDRDVTGTSMSLNAELSPVSPSHAYLAAYPGLHFLVLSAVYFVIIFTDITTPPECCLEHVGQGRMDDYLNVAVYRLLKFCARARKLIANTIRKCRRNWGWCCYPCCKSQLQKDAQEKQEKKLMQQQKMQKIQSMFSEVFITDVSCCICCMEYKAQECLVLLPCPSRHYFHKNCAIAWLSKHDSCPLCRFRISEALDQLSVRPT